MNLNLTTATRIGLNVLALVAVCAALYLGAKIFIPTTIAVLLAAILWPAANWMTEKLRIPRFLACLTMIIGLVVLHMLIIGAFTFAIARTVEELPKDEQDWASRYKDIHRNLSKIVPFNLDSVLREDPGQSDVFRYLKQFFQGDGFANFLGKLSGAGAGLMFEAVLVLFITLFLLLEGQMLSDKIRAIFGPSVDVQGRITQALAEMAEAVRTYLVWRTIVNMGLTIVLGLFYHQIGVKYWYTWALLTGVLSYVPYLGTIVAGVPPVIDGLLFGGPEIALGVLVFYTGLVTVEGYIIVPWVMGRSMDLNATTVIVSCLFWDFVWGIAGLFLAMPLMAAVKAVCVNTEGWQSWGHLMGSEPAVPLDKLNEMHDKHHDIAAHPINGQMPNNPPKEDAPGDDHKSG
jgi:AI-2 transport protein TqsA